MPLWASFCSGAYRARSRTINASTCVNLFPETMKSAANAKQATLYGTPGMDLQLTVDTEGCRGNFSQDGRTWSVVGNQLYEINTSTWVETALGEIVDDGAPVSFASNGRGGEQLAICGGGQLKIFDLLTNILSAAISLPLTNAPVQLAFIDGYFMLLEADTIRVWFSNLEEGTIWDALDFFAQSQTSDNNIGMIVLRNRLWLFRSKTTSVYYDTGDADNPFQPYPGSVMQEGAVTPWAIVIVGESVVWLSQDAHGRNRIVAAADYNPQPVSTPAIDFALASYGDNSDIEAVAYEQEGHQFAIFTSPAGDVTWGYDATENEWHQRAGWDLVAGAFTRWRVRGLCATSEGIMVGDFETGELSLLDLDTFEDATRTIRREKISPYLSAENQWLFLDQFELGIQAGVGLPSGQGSDPEVLLAVSYDGGVTYTDAGTAGIGVGGPGDTGDYTARAYWVQLGRSRADRLVMKVTQSDPVRTVWGPGAWLRATPGSGQL